MSIGILILRLVVGLTLAAHGAQKLFGWFGGYGLTGTGGFLEQLGFVPGRRAALAAGLAEAGAGLLLGLGPAPPGPDRVRPPLMDVDRRSAHPAPDQGSAGHHPSHTIATAHSLH